MIIVILLILLARTRSVDARLRKRVLKNLSQCTLKVVANQREVFYELHEVQEKSIQRKAARTSKSLTAGFSSNFIFHDSENVNKVVVIRRHVPLPGIAYPKCDKDEYFVLIPPRLNLERFFAVYRNEETYKGMNASDFGFAVSCTKPSVPYPLVDLRNHLSGAKSWGYIKGKEVWITTNQSNLLLIEPKNSSLSLSRDFILSDGFKCYGGTKLVPAPSPEYTQGGACNNYYESHVFYNITVFSLVLNLVAALHLGLRCVYRSDCPCRRAHAAGEASHVNSNRASIKPETSNVCST